MGGSDNKQRIGFREFPQTTISQTETPPKLGNLLAIRFLAEDVMLVFPNCTGGDYTESNTDRGFFLTFSSSNVI